MKACGTRLVSLNGFDGRGNTRTVGRRDNGESDREEGVGVVVGVVEIVIQLGEVGASGIDPVAEKLRGGIGETVQGAERMANTRRSHPSVIQHVVDHELWRLHEVASCFYLFFIFYFMLPNSFIYGVKNFY